MPLHILAVVVLVVGAAFLAQTSLPGDFMYPVKTNLTEVVRAMAAFSNEDKAEIASAFALKRLKEAEELSAKGDFTREARRVVQEQFAIYSDRVAQQTADLKREGKTEEVADFQSRHEVALRAHLAVIARLNEGQGTTTTLIPLLNDVKKQIRKAEAIRLDAEGKLAAEIDTEDAAVERLSRAETLIEETKRYLEGARVRAGAGAVFDAEVKLANARASLLDGRVKMAAGRYQEAALLFQSAARLAQEAKLNADLSTAFKIGSTTASIEGEATTAAAEGTQYTTVRGLYQTSVTR